jgi:hypothetical protein
MDMNPIEALMSFNARRAREERDRAECAANGRDRELHLELATIFERRAERFAARW